MEIEKDNTFPFLDTTVTRDSDGLLTTTVYRKPTHTDQYLAYDSHYPQSVKRGIVKSLYDRAKHRTTKPSVIQIYNRSPLQKECIRFSAAAYNIKAYGPYSSLTQRLGLTWCDLKTPRTNETKRCRLQDPM